MRRLPIGSWSGTLAAAIVLALPMSSGAQERTMRFRPVPSESTSSYDARDRQRSEDSTTTNRHGRIPPVPGVPAVPPVPNVDAPEPPEPPEHSSGRSTSGDIVRFGSDITVQRDQTIDGDVVGFGGSIEVLGHVTGNVSAMGGDLTLTPSARVDGDVVCIGGTLREESGSSVGGQRVTAPRSPGAKLFFPMLSVVGTGVKMLMHGLGMLLMLGIAWLFAKLAPARTAAAIDQIEREPGPSSVIGLLLWALIIPSVIALALVIAVLCITIIGIPLAAAVALAYCGFFVLAALWGTVVGYGLLGRRIYPRFREGTATLFQSLLWGGIALHGMRIASDAFHVVPVFGFVGGLLTLIHFILVVSLGTLGAGALVRGSTSGETSRPGGRACVRPGTRRTRAGRATTCHRRHRRTTRRRPARRRRGDQPSDAPRCAEHQRGVRERQRAVRHQLRPSPAGSPRIGCRRRPRAPCS
jgi:hypothetical protein